MTDEEKIKKLTKLNRELRHQIDVLKKRLFYCKRDNKINVEKLKAVIRMLTDDSEEQYFFIKEPNDLTWNTDEILAGVILKSLKRFKNVCEGIPSDIATKFAGSDIDAKKEWDKILDAMIYAFELAKHNSEIMTEREIKAKQYGLSLFIQYFDSIWN